MLIAGWLWCLAGGTLAGLLAGLLGIGGGLVVVPLLVFLLPMLGVSAELVMPTAIATSLATICMTTLSASRAHAKHGQVDSFWVKRLIPGLVLGAAAGALLATVIDPIWLKRIFAAVMILLSIRMLMPSREGEPLVNAPYVVVASGGTAIGLLSALVGIGGGALTVPFLQRLQLPVRRAIAVSSVASLTIAISAVLMFLLLGQLHLREQPSAILGYINLQAWLGISIASVLVAPLGARLTQRLPVRRLQQIFAGFLVIVGVHLLQG
ncbi:sulfite exporter TauE/SafE family protein [Idiomarina xiamenensis]|uniref:Probable membrane transporter protein n=1 Tax=Idiomarina xiamenensis 10-D-4 TaxID=740709 RepID=K2KEW6_9GAMM|nr:sulfite exporter TauE/SafE family protein [Idiomarina xiamenensis]EKE85262.1 permease [Idiomarina xiamenensis 10-D-4]